MRPSIIVLLVIAAVCLGCRNHRPPTNERAVEAGGGFARSDAGTDSQSPDTDHVRAFCRLNLLHRDEAGELVDRESSPIRRAVFEKHKTLTTAGWGGGPLTYEELRATTELELGTIDRLDELVCLPNLKRLSIDNVTSGSLEPLSELELRELRIARSPVGSVQPLEEMESLEVLELPHCEITDVSPLASLSRLRRLDLRGNPLSHVDVTRHMSALSTLNLDGAEVKKLGGFAPNSPLRWLSIRETNISDLSRLEGQKGLKTLRARRSQVRVLDALTKLPKLERAGLCETPAQGEASAARVVERLRKRGVRVGFDPEECTAPYGY